MTSASLLLDLSHVDVGNGLLPVEDLGNFFKGRTFGLNIAAFTSASRYHSEDGGLDVHKVHKDKFDSDPQSVEEREVPVVGKVLPCDGVGLTVGRG
jgi:hypothetical protein